MDGQHTPTQANVVGLGAADPSVLERRAQRLMDAIFRLQGPMARIDWRHDSARAPGLWRIEDL